MGTFFEIEASAFDIVILYYTCLLKTDFRLFIQFSYTKGGNRLIEDSKKGVKMKSEIERKKERGKGGGGEEGGGKKERKSKKRGWRDGVEEQGRRRRGDMIFY